MVRCLDTNVILRHLLKDDPKKAEGTRRLVARLESGQERLFTTALVVAEVVWVAESTYDYPKPKLIELLHSLLNTPNLEFDHRDLLLEATALFGLKPVDFIDAYNAAAMHAHGLKDIYSYDTDFDGLPGIQRLEP
jgi:predicted nucleic acid-binding protein